MMGPIGRLAPSPTGLLHLGHARTFLLAWWSVRSRGGRILMRLEDLDGDRSKPEWCDAALRDLEWLGLDWDGTPRLQSEHMGAMLEVAHGLETRGLAYPCVCSRADIRSASSAPHGTTGETPYPGTCQARFQDRPGARAATGLDPGLRFRVPTDPVTFLDDLQGPTSAHPAQECGDFLILKRDERPAYQLAVVVDDLAQGITEVLRGDDLLPSTARQELLYRALAQPPPTWRHVPLVTDHEGKRLAKRDASLSLAELRATGVDPRTIATWALTSSFRIQELDADARLTPEECLRQVDFASLVQVPVERPTDTALGRTTP